MTTLMRTGPPFDDILVTVSFKRKASVGLTEAAARHAGIIAAPGAFPGQAEPSGFTLHTSPSGKRYVARDCGLIVML